MRLFICNDAGKAIVLYFVSPPSVPLSFPLYLSISSLLCISLSSALSPASARVLFSVACTVAITFSNTPSNRLGASPGVRCSQAKSKAAVKSPVPV